ncbi:hypothetical protein HGI09_13690 [Streptomyces collinus]|nr:hypothetical protein HGI09_13690 [Streptomyces collinus]
MPHHGPAPNRTADNRTAPRTPTARLEHPVPARLSHVSP